MTEWPFIIEQVHFSSYNGQRTFHSQSGAKYIDLLGEEGKLENPAREAGAPGPIFLASG